MRALVHRRTLVTAGLFILFIFFEIFVYFFFVVVFLVGLVRVFFSSVVGVLEKDIKKIVALRTLSQISLCFLSFSLGFYFLGFFHLLRHAFFKSFLFIQMGFVIGFFLGQQDLRLGG